MALHEASVARSSHYPQWHCGPKMHLLATNDILHLLGKHSTTWPQRAHHHLSGQRSAVLPRYRLVPCKQLSRLRNNQRRVHIWSNPNQYSCAPRLGYFVCTRSIVNFATRRRRAMQSSSYAWELPFLRNQCQSSSFEIWNTSQYLLPNIYYKKNSRRYYEDFKKEFRKKLQAPKLRKSADKSLSQPGCSHSNRIYDLQLQKTIVLRVQPRQEATLTQPLQCDLQRLSCKTQ